MKILIRSRQRYQRLDRKKIETTASNILTILKQPDSELSILFVGNKKMQELNSAFRSINKTTDVLSFEAGLPIKGDAGNILGDIVINIYRAASQAEAAGMGLYEEITRLLIHGILHLLGYEHEKGGADAKRMEKKEEEVLTLLQNSGASCQESE
jgi:probable rRNA maturation factor